MKPTDKICVLDARVIDRDCIHRAAAIIKQGGVVVFPTRGLYGLGACALNAAAAERVFRLKGRERSKPLLVLVADIMSLQQVARPPDHAARHLMQSFWPGRVTFVIPAKKQVGEALTGGSGKIGVRIPGHPIATALVKAVGGPVTGTSANLSNTGGCAAVGDLAPAINNGADLILDAGPLAGGTGSTVVDICGTVPVILREGAVAGERIMTCHRQFLRKHIDIKP